MKEATAVGPWLTKLIRSSAGDARKPFIQAPFCEMCTVGLKARDDRALEGRR